MEGTRWEATKDLCRTRFTRGRGWNVKVRPVSPSHCCRTSTHATPLCFADSNSSSSFASADSSMPSTPLDLAFNEQGQQESFYPIPAAQAARASHHTSSFTDHNGTTHVFSSSPPLSVYPPPANSPSDLYVSNPMESAPFPMHAWGAKSAPTTTSGVLRMGAGEPEVIRELHHPAPAWNGFRQASTYGSHMM